MTIMAGTVQVAKPEAYEGGLNFSFEHHIGVP